MLSLRRDCGLFISALLTNTTGDMQLKHFCVGTDKVASVVYTFTICKEYIFFFFTYICFTLSLTFLFSLVYKIITLIFSD